MDKKVLKRILVCLVAVLFFTQIMFVGISQANGMQLETRPYSEVYQRWMELSEEERQGTIPPPMFEMKYHPNKEKTYLEHIKSSILSTVNKYSLTEDIDIVIKNQEDTSSCWAFASMSAVETNIAMTTKDKTGKAENYDFSEKHLEYATTKSFIDGENDFGFNRELNTGKLFIKGLQHWSLMAYFTNGSGPILEEDMPFYDGKDIENQVKKPLSYISEQTVQKKVDKYINFPSISRQDKLNNTYTEQELKEFRNEIKEHILNYGSVMAGMYSPQKQEDIIYVGGDAERGVVAFYCNDINNYGNHEISIVGWDDNYSKDNFHVDNKPSKDGAYIIRNSWGEDQGEDGYFYVSYEDYIIEEKMTGIIEVEDVNYDNLYQHDILGNSEYIGLGDNIIYGANIFSRDSSKKEMLNEISITSEYNNASYEVYINPKNNSLTTSDFTKVKTTETLQAGYHTIKLDTPIELTGSEFVVKVKFNSTESKGYPIPVESDLGYVAESNPLYSFMIENPWKDVNISKKSYVSDNETTWQQLLERDICIKAFTTIDTSDIDININSNIYNVSKNKKQISKIKPNTTVTTLLGNITTGLTTEILDASGDEIIGTAIVGTGMVLRLGNGSDYTMVVTGDLDGNGEITLNDLAKLKLHIIETQLLTGAFLAAGNVDYQGEITLNDLAIIKKIIIGLMELTEL